jgi:EmrB/QacA subfamily drug resistance transporter
MSDSRPGGISASGRGWALGAVGAVVFLTFLDTTIVSVALADVQSTLHAGVSELQWVVNAYALVFASLMLGAGTLGDRFGRKRVMLAGVAIFIAGSLLGGLAPNVETLIGARALMGLGAAASEPGTLSVIRHLFPESDMRARALGVWAAIAGLALALGPVIGGVLVGLGGWRGVFWFNLAAAMAILLVSLVTVPESADPQRARLDIAGFTLGPVALGALTFAVIVGETSGYGSWVVVALFVVGVILTVLFVIAEWRSRAPVLDVRYLRRPSFSGALVVAFGAYFGIFSIFFFTALYLQVVVGYSGYRIAGVFAPMAAAMIVSSLVAGRWVSHTNARLPMTVGCLAAGLGILLTDVALRGQANFGSVAVSLTLAGIGFGVAVVPVTSVALAVVPAEHSGMAASATMTSRELGTVLGVAVLGSLVNSHLTGDLTRRLVDLGVPAPFQKVVITAVETGQVPGGSQAAGAQQAFGPIVAKVIDAAFGAFRAGLSIALIISGVMLLGAGLVAWLTIGRCTRRSEATQGGHGSPGSGEGSKLAEVGSS